MKGESLKLLPEKAIYWGKKEYLILSDLHLGKAGHFRRNGIPISRNVHFEDLRILETLLQVYQPTSVILLGDLFHSFKNNEWDDFLRFMDVYDFINFILVKGNHDILKDYPRCLDVVDRLDVSPFTFTHEKEEATLYNLSGHVHPGYRVSGLGRGGVTLPCFLFSENYGILPAFGQFTGIKKIKKKEEDRIFGIVDSNIIELI
ncbi:MAG: ligase-associated DNA damage response endonuclease PdeM [Bacteroidota bacterium]